MGQFSVHEAKTKLSQLIANALAGADMVITRGNVPVVRLVPVEPRGRRQFGALKGKIAMDAGFDEPLPADEQERWVSGLIAKSPFL
jgi:prevent-host-death family protein